MTFSRVGGLIAAANPNAAFPLSPVGSITAIKRIVMLFLRAGAFPIVVVTGAQENEVRYELSASGVVFLPVEGRYAPELFESVKTGLAFLRGKCDRVVFTPVNAAMFSPEVLSELLGVEGDVVTPSFERKGGHPVTISAAAIDHILDYAGPNGLRGALSSMGGRRKWLETNEPGVIRTVHTEFAEPLKEQPHPVVELRLERENVFFGSRAKLLLLLIAHTRSVRGACDMMALSYSKAWNMLNQIEGELGFALVQRRHGGSHGGRTDLTERGYTFLAAYQRMEEDVILGANRRFRGFWNEAGFGG